MNSLPQDEVFVFPMSFSQRRFWFLEQWEPGTSLYTMPMAVRIQGAIDVLALTAALNDVVARHEGLRTTFAVADGGDPSQFVHSALQLPLPVKDSSSASTIAAEAQLLCTGFDLEHGPLIRGLLIRISASEHVLLLTAHHIVFDGWSVQLLVREMAAFYAARIAGLPGPYPPLELQYADFACWQREWLSGEVREEQLEFWRQHLLGAPTILELPCDRPRPATQSFAGARLTLPIPDPLRASLREIARHAEATEFMVFFAAFHVLLARLANTENLVVGTPFANRHRVEIEPIIGLFVNTLAIRSRLDDDPPFCSFLGKFRETILDAQRYQDLPFELLVDELSPERNLSHSPIFQVMFVWENTRTMRLSGGGLEITPYDIPVSTAKFDLTLFLEDGAGGLRATWEYGTALFDASTIERFARYFETLLASIAASGGATTVGRLSILPAEERRQLLDLWNDTWMPLPEILDFGNLFTAQAMRTPNSVAAHDTAGPITYAELNEQANQLANHLRARGLGPGDVIGLYLPRSRYLMVAVVAALKAGTAYVPLDSSYPADRLQFMMEDSGAALILTQNSLLHCLPESVPRLSLDQDMQWTACSTDNPAVTIHSDDLAYILYTSGSTGRPKGAEITHRGLANYLLWALREYRIKDGSGVPMHSSISFDATITAWLAPLLAGVTLHILPEGGEVEALAELLQTDAQYSLVKITPAHMEALQHLLPRNTPVPGAKAFIIGGEALFGKQLSFWRRNAPATRMINEYGPTETVVGCCVYEVRPGHAYPGAVPIGRPIANTQLYVLARNGEPVPIGTTGELYIGGAGVARGYRNRPEWNVQRFLPNPFGPGKLYRTGDLVRYLPDGNLIFIGRTDDQVKIRGFRVELGEIETVLARHPGVREVVVIADDAEGHKRLVAYYVPTEEPVTVTSLRAWIGAELPEYMLPAIFIDLPSIPLTVNGKIDRRALPAPVRRPAIGFRQVASNEAEATLLRIWREVLRVEQVGIDDNFFELGGDSILSLQVVTRARESGLPLTAKQVFQHQTISALAAVALEAVPSKAVFQSPVTGDVPLTPIQHWFFAQRQQAPAHYTQSVLLRIAPESSQKTIELAFHEVIRHHDALRLRFAGGRQWHNSAKAGCGPQPTRNSRPPKAATESVLREFLESDGSLHASRCAGGFAAAVNDLDLEHGPVIVLQRPAPDQLFLAIHHLVVDGVSWRILLQDLCRAYEQLHRGEPVQLPPKTSSFQSWAQALVERRKQFHSEWDRWRAMLSPHSAELPGRVDSTGRIEGELSVAATELLLRLAPAAYQTQVNDLLLSALAIALGPDTIDLESHGREPIFEDLDLSRTVGWFTAIYPVRLAPPSYELPALLPWVKEQLRNTPNGGIGYGVLRYLDGREDLASTARLKFNYLGRVEDFIPNNALIRSLVTDTTVEDQHPANQRSHIWEVTAVVLEGRLRVAWEYSRSRHSSEEVAALHGRFLAALEEVAAHCAAVVNSRSQDAVAYPLSPMQQGMLFESLLAPDSGVYVEQMAVEIQGALDVTRFQQAWQGIVDREEALRTVFRWRGLEQPVQTFAGRVPLAWHYEDLQGRDPAPVVKPFRDAERRRGFDLTVAPLLRFALFRVSETHWYFVWTYHHLLLDGWSRHRVVNAVVQAYASGSFAPAATPYRTFIEWIGCQDRKKLEQFWRRELSGFAEPTPLMIDRPAPKPGPAVRIGCSLSEADTSALQRLARTHRLTVNTLVQGAWALLLSRYSGRSEVLFGVTVAGRPPDLPGVEEIIGLFINTLPLRVSVDENRSWVEWLSELQLRQREMDDFSHASLMELKAWSGVPRELPLFESIVVFENFPAAEIRFSAGGLTIAHAEFSEQTNVPLVLVAAPGASLHLELEFDSARFSKPRAEQIGMHLRNLLRSLPSLSSSATIADWPLLTPQETEHLLVGCNLRRLDHDRARSSLCAHELFAAVANETPDAIAILDRSGPLSFGRLNRRANQLGHRLRALGLGPESVVGVCMERSADVVIAILGIWKAGAAYAPFDPSYPADRLAFMIQDSGARLVLTHSQVAGVLPANASTLCLDLDDCSHEPDTEPDTGVTPDNLAYLIYTSGSTGMPKGVMIEHRSCVEHCLTIIAEYGHTPASRLLLFVPISFDQSVEDIFPTLFAGAGLVLPRPGAPPTISELLSWIDEYGVTMLHLPTAYWHHWSSLLERYPVPESLLTVKVGGELAPLAAFQAWTQGVRPSVRFVNGYGPTEVTVTSHVFHSTSPIDPAATSVPIGKTLPNTLSYVLDSRLRPVPYGVPGELFIGGIRVGRGYHNRPDLTAERFLRNPFGPGTMYRTGDLVRYLEDGSFEFLGRIDQQVKIRGFRIELGEIETLLNHHPAVRQSAVTAVPAVAGSTLVAFVCARKACVSTEELRRYLGKLLPEYMVPSQFVWLEALPVSPSGKIDRRALPLPASTTEPVAAAASPLDGWEQQLTGIWEDVLDCSVGREDNFFALGGHSLAAIRLMARIEASFGCQLPLSLLLEHPSVAALAACLRSKETSVQWSPLVAIQPRGQRRLFCCVHGGGGSVLHYHSLAKELGSSQPFYALQSVGLDGVTEPLRSVEKMAALYLAELRNVQPVGPYRLGGHSLGGQIAYEMARQLVQSGQAVECLVVMDTYCPGGKADAGQAGWSHQRWIQEFVSLLGAFFGCPLGLLAQDLEPLSPDARLALVHARLLDAGVIPPGSKIGPLKGLFSVFQANNLLDYAPQADGCSLPVPILLLRGRDSSPSGVAAHLHADPCWGWSAFSTFPVDLRLVPGDHIGMMSVPHVASVAAELRSILF